VFVCECVCKVQQCVPICTYMSCTIHTSCPTYSVRHANMLYYSIPSSCLVSMEHIILARYIVYACATGTTRSYTYWHSTYDMHDVLACQHLCVVTLACHTLCACRTGISIILIPAYSLICFVELACSTTCALCAGMWISLSCHSGSVMLNVVLVKYWQDTNG
jgi:hypothetical protein